MALPDGKWYDNANVGELHDDLRSDYNKTIAIVLDRPGLRRHSQECDVCQQIRAEHETDLDAPPAPRQHRRRKLVLTYADIAHLLSLRPEQEITSIEIRQDPMELAVSITGPDEPLVPVDAEAPVLRVGVA